MKVNRLRRLFCRHSYQVLNPGREALVGNKGAREVVGAFGEYQRCQRCGKVRIKLK
jgi:RNase P subunit RPR2